MTTSYQNKILKMRTELVAYYPLNEQGGTVVYDLSKHGYNGTSSALVRHPATRGFRTPDGLTCAQFDGSSSYIDIHAISPSSANAALTFSIWAAIDDSQLTGTTTKYIARVSADTANSIEIVKDGTAQRFSGNYYAGAGDATYSTTYGQKVYNDIYAKQFPKWHHFAITADAGTADSAYLYVDGVASTACTSLGTWTGAFDDTCTCLGASNTGASNAFKGYLAHAAMWSVVLSAAEIRELYKIGP